MRPYQLRSKETLLEWTERTRRFGDRPPEIIYPLRHIYDDACEELVILKAAQVFISEYLINSCFYVLDTAWGGRGNAIYIMPNQNHMDDFSRGRIKEAVEQSPHLTERVDTANTRQYKISGRSLYTRGSETVSQIRSVDADIAINDEVDLFSGGSIAKSKERLGSARMPLYRAASQPTYPEVGIDVLYQASDMRHWYLKCPRCNHWQTINWDENVTFNLDDSGHVTEDTKVVVVCAQCRKPLDRLADGEWVAEHPGRFVHGYHISKLLSPRANFRAMLERFLAVDDIEKLQSFYQADLGIPYRPFGSKADIADFTREYYEKGWQQPVTESYAGIDVGTLLHFTLMGRASPDDPYRLVTHKTFQSFEELDAAYRYYSPRYSVIDARGDPRATLEWAQKYPGKVYRWQHHPSKTEPAWDDDKQEVKIDRTALLDTSYMWLRAQPARLILHTNIGADFVAQITALVRELVKNPEGKLIPRYVGQRVDHYAFSIAYAIIAAAEFGGSVGTKMRVVVKEDVHQSPSFHAPRPRWTGSQR